MRLWLVIAAVTALGSPGPGAAFAQGPKAQGPAKEFAGTASHYGKGYSGKTASGVRYDPSKLTAAHRTLPFGTKVLVVDKATKRSVTVVVNDRGPFIKGRVIDLSYAAAQALKMEHRGLIKVTASVQ
ncbi:MAG TPA: septal ring lytic transglycosylase RlpA family protein [Pseudolabrys sp.]|nr:septal ring lytic transglycosylase RlpA family protein [Pseudolabrys sp.]